MANAWGSSWGTTWNVSWGTSTAPSGGNSGGFFSMLAFWMGGAASPTGLTPPSEVPKFMGAAGLFLTPSKRKFRKFAKWKPQRRER